MLPEDTFSPMRPLVVVDNWDGKRPRVLICRTTRFGPDRPSCGNRGSEALLNAFQESLRSAGLMPKVDLIASPCLGYCTKGPNVRVAGQSLHHAVVLQDIPRILEQLQVVINDDDSESPPSLKNDKASEI